MRVQLVNAAGECECGNKLDKYGENNNGENNNGENSSGENNNGEKTMTKATMAKSMMVNANMTMKMVQAWTRQALMVVDCSESSSASCSRLLLIPTGDSSP